MREIKDCNVAVVGGAGFLGSHLVDYLIEERDCNVLVIDNLVAGKIEWINKSAAFEHHDITDSEEHLKREFSSFQISGSKSKGVDYVFQYAAHPYVPDSYSRPLHVADVNFFGAMKVINAAQEAGVKGILQVSSAEVYGEGSETREPFTDGFKIDERALILPHSTYGASKAAIDSWVQVRWREAKTPCIALRQFNCVGARETHPYVVPEIISQINFQMVKTDLGYMAYINPGEFVKVKLGNNSSRDFMDAKDAVRMSVELLERGEFGQVYNLGSEDSIKVYDLAVRIGRLMGVEVQVVEDESRKRPWEIWHLASSNQKILKAIDRTPSTAVNGLPMTPLDDSLKAAIGWFNQNGSRWPWER